MTDQELLEKWANAFEGIKLCVESYFEALEKEDIPAMYANIRSILAWINTAYGILPDELKNKYSGLMASIRAAHEKAQREKIEIWPLDTVIYSLKGLLLDFKDHLNADTNDFINNAYERLGKIVDELEGNE